MRRYICFWQVLFCLISIQSFAQRFYSPYGNCYGFILKDSIVTKGQKLHYDIILSDSCIHKKARVSIINKNNFFKPYKSIYSKIYNTQKQFSDSIDLSFLKKTGNFHIYSAIGDDLSCLKGHKKSLFTYHKKPPKELDLKIEKPNILFENMPTVYWIESNFPVKIVLNENKVPIDSINVVPGIRNLLRFIPKATSTYSIISKSKKLIQEKPPINGFFVDYLVEKDSTHFFISSKIPIDSVFFSDQNYHSIVFSGKGKHYGQIKFANKELSLGTISVSIFRGFGESKYFNFLHGGGQLEFTEKEKAMLFDIGQYRIPRNISNIYELNRYVFH